MPIPNSPLTLTGNDVTTWNPWFQVYGGQNASFIVWGTEGILGTWIVVSARESLRVEEIDIEQGAGFEAIVILLNKGVNLEMTVIDDASQVTVPTISNVTWSLVTPYGTIPMILVESAADQARKREGQRTFTFKSFNAINNLH